ncbi:hypothetical protein LEN26_020131 [Aphanomyces euteiches]|nr:hypothetical protein LEN26_020131 [Aphanomyces euteiches]KAH9128918.1 hypothetical protein AeMF1_000965 [Aphanomyces euteiches]KAH9131506.1 hypothetical protein AeNC1_019607 [Aphanomyces euteiches]
MLQQAELPLLQEPLLGFLEAPPQQIANRQFHFQAGCFLSNEFGSNRVTTSMYTPWTFFPKFFAQTFSKMNNLYFLFVCILEMIPGISTTNGFPTTAMPLIFVTAVDACFRLVEDYARHCDDDKANNRQTLRLGPSLSFEPIPWADVRVGDILKVVNGDLVPADMVLLHVDDPTSATFCYVETSSLDGETNLKLRQSLMETQTLPLEKLRGHIDCDAPNAGSSFSGTLVLSDSLCAIPMGASNVLLRDCVLRNTRAVIGVVCHSGHDTKVMQCTRSCPTKQSRIDRLVNRELVYIFGLTMSLCLIAAAASCAFDRTNVPHAWYFHRQVAKTPVLLSFITSFLGFFLMLSNAVPISLYVTLNVVKALQARTIEADLAIATPTTKCKVKTIALNDDLGQISHIVTDKTGTLTRNVMVFRSCSVRGTLYGHFAVTSRRCSQGQSKWLAFEDPTFSRRNADITEFLLHLALNHSVLVDEPPMSLDALVAAASCPDEKALLAMAYAHGYEFIRRSPGKALLRVPGHADPVEFTILHVLEFTSTRKRMSVIIRNPLRDNAIELLIKGADSVLLPRATAETPHLEATTRHLKQLAQSGLRTLVLGKRILDETLFHEWEAKYKAAMQDLSQLQRQAAGAPNTIDELMDSLECELDILGATGIEDGLQDSVPESIEKLRIAGIKIWMLTGDHVDTAINVARAANLLKNTAVQLTLVSPDTVGDDLANILRSLLSWQKYALVVDGETLASILKQCHEKAKFVSIIKACEVVLACRVSPLQKSQIVDLIKAEMDDNGRVLAIGDGANDVAMIQNAHVGVGISGQEGTQAANCSDDSIGEFSFLVRLLFVHGRRNYMRVSFLIPYIFYKNMLLVLSEFWYCMVSGVSGQKFYNQVAVDLFNTFYTALPIVVFAVYDKDLPSWLCERLPNLYGRVLFHRWVIWKWMAFGLVESFVICMVAVLTTSGNDARGRPFGMWECGAITFTQIVLVVNYKLALHQNTWKQAQVLALLAGISCWFVSGFILSASPVVSFQWFDVFPIVMGSFFYWFASLIIPVIALSFDFVSLALGHSFSPSNERVLQEALCFPDEVDLHLRLFQLPQKQPTLSTGFAVGFDAYTARIEADFCRQKPLQRRRTVH